MNRQSYKISTVAPDNTSVKAGTHKLLISLCGQVTDKLNEKIGYVCLHELLRLVAQNNVIIEANFKDNEDNRTFLHDRVNDFNKIEKPKSEINISDPSNEPKEDKEDRDKSILECVIIMNGVVERRKDIAMKTKESVPVIIIEQSGDRRKQILHDKYFPNYKDRRPDVDLDLIHYMTPAQKSRHIAKAILKAIAKALNKLPSLKGYKIKQFIYLCLCMDHFHIAVKAKLLSKAIDSQKDCDYSFKYDLLHLMLEKWKLVGERVDTEIETKDETPNKEEEYKKITQNVAAKFCEIFNETNALIVKNETNKKDEEDRCIETCFLLSLMRNQVKSAEALWYFVTNPLTAALIARGVLKSQSESVDERTLKENLKCFERLANEFVGHCYNRNAKTTFNLLKNSSTVWGSRDCVKLALYTENRKFLSQPALIDYNRRMWFFGTTEIVEKEIEMANNDSIINWLKIIVYFLSCRASGRGGQCSYGFTPMCQFTVDTIGLLFNLLIYAGILMYVLKAKDIHWTEYVFCAYIIPLFIEECRQMYSDGKSYFKSVKNVLDITAVLLFLLAFLLRLAAYTDPLNTDLMGWTRIIYSLDFIAFAFLMFEKFYASDFLGPLLAIIGQMTVTLFKFLLVLGIVFAAFAVASESVMYPNYDLKIQHIYSMSQRAFYNMFGEFSLETFQTLGHDCTNDPLLYNNNTANRCVTAHAVYFVPILLAFFVFIVNILLFNLLIASFNSKIVEIELKSKEIWHSQLCQLTIEYTGHHVLPIPFLIYTFYQLFCNKTGSKASTTKSDIITVIDSSGSIGVANFKTLLKFIGDLLRNFKIGKSDVLVGNVVYSNSAEKKFDLKDNPSDVALSRALSKTPYVGNGTNTDLALKLIMEDQMFSPEAGGRTDAKQIVIVFTDGSSNDTSKTKAVAAELKGQGVLVISVGVGSATKDSELQDMASGPQYVFKKSFDALSQIERSITQCTCQASVDKKTEEKFEEQEMLKVKKDLELEKRFSKLRKSLGLSTAYSNGGVTQNIYYIGGAEADDKEDENDGLSNILENWNFQETDNSQSLSSDKHAEDENSKSEITTGESENTSSFASSFPNQELSIQPREGMTSSLASLIVSCLRAELKECDILSVCNQIRAMLRRRGNVSASYLQRPSPQNITIPQEFARTVADQVTKQLKSLLSELIDRNEEASLSPYVNMDSRLDREAATVILRNTSTRASGAKPSSTKGAKAKNAFYVVRRRSRYGLNWKWYDVGAGRGDPRKSNPKRDDGEQEKSSRE